MTPPISPKSIDNAEKNGMEVNELTAEQQKPLSPFRRSFPDLRGAREGSGLLRPHHRLASASSDVTRAPAAGRPPWPSADWRGTPDGSHRLQLGRFVQIIADVAAGAACGGILVVVLVQVAGRLVGHPLPWTEEATRFLFVWMVFLGLAAGFRTVESARVVVFIAMARRLSGTLPCRSMSALSVLFFVLMGWTGITLVRQQIMMNEKAATLAIPMWVIGLVMPISSVIAILAIVESLRTAAT